MEITKEVLEEFISLTLGEDILPLIHILWKRRNVSEFKLADRLNITVNQVRNMLYRLSEFNLVTSIRKKDKKKGWYIYYWSLNKKSVFNVIWKFRRKKYQEFTDRLKREEAGIFYVCPSGCMRVNMESAMEYDFYCQECGTLFMQQDNNRTIKNLKKRINEMAEELKEFEEHMDNIREKAKRKMVRDAAKAAKAEKERLSREAKKRALKLKKAQKEKEEKRKEKKKAVKKKVKKRKVVKKKIKKVKKKKPVKKKTKVKKVKKKFVKKKVKKKVTKKKTKKRRK